MQNLLAFKLYGMTHIIFLIIAVAIVVGLFFLMRNFEGKAQKYTSITLVSVAGVLCVLEFVGRIIAKMDVGENLPLAPWNIFVYICIFVEITKKESWIKFGYFITIPVSVLALFITPSIFGEINEASLPIIFYFLINSIVILYSLLRIKWLDEPMYKMDILNCTMNYTIILAIVHMLNVVFRFTTIGIHANYFGTMGEDYDVLMKFVSGLIPVPFLQIIPMLAVLVGIEFLMILPWLLRHSREKNRAHIEELVALGNLKAQQEYRKSGKGGGSQVLVRSEEKAKPVVPKNTASSTTKDGFVSVTKQVNVNNEHKDNL